MADTGIELLPYVPCLNTTLLPQWTLCEPHWVQDPDFIPVWASPSDDHSYPHEEHWTAIVSISDLHRGQYAIDHPAFRRRKPSVSCRIGGKGMYQSNRDRSGPPWI